MMQIVVFLDLHNVPSYTLGDFTFGLVFRPVQISTKIRTEQKLSQKAKLIFLFALSPNFGLSETLS